MNAVIGIVSEAHETAQAAAGTMTANLPLIVRIPVGILVWAIAFLKSIVLGLIGLVATLAAVAFTAHAIFNQGKSGIELFQNWLQIAQQNLTGTQLASATAALGLATAAWLYKSRGTLGKIEHIVNRAGYMLGYSKEDPEIADVRATAARLGYVLVPMGTTMDAKERPLT